jgi:hypothetical protein
MTDAYAGRRLEILARDRARFGAGAIDELPAVLEQLGATIAFVVTDGGVVRSGAAGRVVDLLRGTGLGVEVFDGVDRAGDRCAPGAPGDPRRIADRRGTRRRIRVGLGEGHRAPRTQSACCHVTWLPR